LFEDGRAEAIDTHMRVSPGLLEPLGRDAVLQIALHLKAQNPVARPRNAVLAKAYRYTANGIELIAEVVLLKGRGGLVPVFVMSTKQEWAVWHEGREERN
jgi:hypothetical protein